jgi:hypothetical protein
MELIDWPGVARNALWILGLSIVLAAWSYTSWWASMRRIKMRHALGLPRFQVPFSIGLFLFCASLAWSSIRWWERGLWIVLGVAFLWQAVMGWRAAARHGWDTLPDRQARSAGDSDQSTGKPP